MHLRKKQRYQRDRREDMKTSSYIDNGHTPSALLQIKSFCQKALDKIILYFHAYTVSDTLPFPLRVYVFTLALQDCRLFVQ